MRRIKRSFGFYRWVCFPVIGVVFCRQYFQYIRGILLLDSMPDSPALVVTDRAFLNSITAFEIAPTSSISSQDKYDATIPSRVFPRYPYPSLPCFPSEPNWYNSLEVQRQPTHTGLLFVKSRKVGGSTVAGIHLRISRWLALEQPSPASFRVPLEDNIKRKVGVRKPFHLCKTRFDHVRGVDVEYRNRIKSQSFLWTVIRKPTSRVTSEFFHFQVSRNRVKPTDSNFLKYIRQDWLDKNNYFANSLSLRAYGGNMSEAQRMEKVPDWSTVTPLQLWPNTYQLGTDIVIPDSLGPRIVRDIVQDYDFIAVIERLDESLVALQMITNAPLANFLFLSSKKGGGYDDGGFKQTCTYIIPKFVSSGMQSFFQRQEWNEISKWDALLFRAVNQSLDRTIDHLGRQEFDRRLLVYRQAQQVVQDRCSNEVLRCSSLGEFQRLNNSCVWLDSGCGSNCLDRVATKLGLWQR